MEKIRLKNGKTYDIGGGASEQQVCMVFDSVADAAPVIEDFTKENLAKVEFLTENGDVCGTYEDKQLVSADFSQKNDKWLVTFRLNDITPSSDEILNIIIGGETA